MYNFDDSTSALKRIEKIIRENAFEQKRKKPGLKFNPGLSANRPSNKWARKLYLVSVANQRVVKSYRLRPSSHDHEFCRSKMVRTTLRSSLYIFLKAQIAY